MDPSFSASPVEEEEVVLGFPISFWNLNQRELPGSFSTNLGARPRRMLEKPFPQPVTRTDLKVDIAIEAARLRNEFPGFIYDVVRPTEWVDILRYFDPYDVYIQGPEFCFYVLIRIMEENERLLPLIEAEILSYAREWIENNADKVLSAAEDENLMDIYFTAEDLDEMYPKEKLRLDFALQASRVDLLNRVRPQTAAGQFDRRAPMFAEPHPGHLLPPSHQQRFSITPVAEVTYPVQSSGGLKEQRCQQPSPQNRTIAQNDSQRRNRTQSNDMPLPSSAPRERRFSIDNSGRHALRYGPQYNRQFTPNHIVQTKTQEEPIFVHKSQLTTSSQGNYGANGRVVSDFVSGGRNSHVAGYQHNLSPSDQHRPQRILQQIPQPVSHHIPLMHPNDYRRFSQDHRPAPPQKPVIPAAAIREQESHFTSRNHGNGFPQYNERLCPSLIQDGLNFRPNQRNSSYTSPPCQSQPAGSRETSYGSPNSANTVIQHSHGSTYQHRGYHQKTTSFNWGHRKPFDGHENVTHHTNGSCTFFYMGPWNESRDEDRPRTVYVGGIDLSVFESHLLKNLFGNEVVSISFVPRGRIPVTPVEGIGFVLFTHPTFAQEAIENYNGMTLPSGRALYIGPALKLNNQNRSRANSSASHNGQHHSHRQITNGTRGFDQGHYGRRPSIMGQSRTQLASYVPHQYSTETSRAQTPTRSPTVSYAFNEQLNLTATMGVELRHQQSRIDRYVPLGSIHSNIRRPGEDDKRSISQITRNNNNKKENHTLKENNGSFTNQRQVTSSKNAKEWAKSKNKNKHRSARDSTTSSSKPTPSVSPRKSPSKSPTTAEFDNVLGHVSERIEQLGKVLPSEVHDRNNMPKKYGADHKILKLAASDSAPPLNVSSPTGTSTTYFTSNTTFQSHAATASHASSRNTSIASTSFGHLAEATVPRVEKSNCEIDSGSRNTSLKNYKRSNKKQKKINIEGELDAPTPRPPKKPHGKKNNQSSKSLRELTPSFEADNAHKQEDEGTPEVSLNKVDNIHYKKGSVTSTTSGMSHRKTDSKASKVAKKKSADAGSSFLKTDGGTVSELEPKSTVENQTQTPEIEPRVNIEDREQFPSLGPASSSPSLIADGKRPAAPTIRDSPQALNKRSNSPGNQKTQTKLIVAIPRVLKSGQKPATDSETTGRFQNAWFKRNDHNMGSRIWAFVKGFRWL